MTLRIITRRQRTRSRDETRTEADAQADLNELDARIEEKMAAMPRNPDAGALHDVLEDFRREYSTYAERNHIAIERIRRVYEGFQRKVYRAMLGLAAVLLVMGAFGLHLQSQGNSTVTKLESSRSVVLKVTCAVESAIAQGGRAVIAGPSKPVPQQEAALRRLGFPPFAVRHAAQEIAADRYVQGIAASIDQQIGRKGDGLVVKGGKVNCNRLSQIAHLGHSPGR